MAERSATIRLTVTDNFSKPLDDYNRKMGQAEDNTRKAGDAAGKGGGLFSSLGDGIRGALGAITLGKVGDLALELADLGSQRDKASQTFEAIAGGAGEADELLRNLKEATGGIVTDLDLMQGAAGLDLTGIATNNDEIVRFTELAVRLGGAMGQDAPEAINNFQMALANLSLVRLDTLGISASAVRERINQLMASGEAMNRSDAFRMAVLEEGAQTIERLGSAAYAGETGLARLQVAIENANGSMGDFLNTGVEGWVTAHDSLVAMNQYYSDQNAAAAAERQAVAEQEMQTVQQLAAGYASAFPDQPMVNEYGAVFGQADVEAQFSLWQRAVQEYELTMQDTVDTTDELANAIMLLTGQPPMFTESMLQGAQYFVDNQKAAEASTQAAATAQSNYNQQLAQANMLRQMDAESMREQEAARNQLLAFGAAANISQPLSPAYMAHVNQQAYERRQQEVRDEGTRAQFSGAMGETESAARAAAFLYQPDMGEGVPDVMTQQQADTIRIQADEAARLAEEMQRLDTITPDLFTDEQMAAAQETANATRDMANEAQRAADALAGMSLSELLGQGSGGAQGELGDLVLARLQERGVGEDQIAAYQEAFDMASGRETAASQTLEQDVVPMIEDIAMQYGAEAANEAMAQVLEVMKSGALEALTPEQIAANLSSATGYQRGPGGDLAPIPQPGSFQFGGGGAAPFAPAMAVPAGAGMPTPGAGAAGATAGAPATGEALPPGVVMLQTAVGQIRTDVMGIAADVGLLAMDFTEAGTAAFTMAEGLPPVTETFMKMLAPARDINTQLTRAADSIQRMASQEWPLRFRVQLWDPYNVMGMINGGFAQVVRDNGGRVAGADGRTR